MVCFLDGVYRHPNKIDACCKIRLKGQCVALLIHRTSNLVHARQYSSYFTSGISDGCASKGSGT
ncbi:MAG: hypothetical protein ACTSRA_04800 [Promethearchaeota archaeon]